ncbi:MAG: hypothetical protein R2874_03540 [Desulfobacterales bacterium]
MEYGLGDRAVVIMDCRRGHGDESPNPDILHGCYAKSIEFASKSRKYKNCPVGLAGPTGQRFLNAETGILIKFFNNIFVLTAEIIFLPVHQNPKNPQLLRTGP